MNIGSSCPLYLSSPPSSVAAVIQCSSQETPSGSTPRWFYSGFLLLSVLCPPLTARRSKGRLLLMVCSLRVLLVGLDAHILSYPDPTLECTSYNYEPVTQAMSSFPPIWSSASILSDDSAALAMWNSISGSIPTDISVKVRFYASFLSCAENFLIR